MSNMIKVMTSVGAGGIVAALAFFLLYEGPTMALAVKKLTQAEHHRATQMATR